MNVKGTVHFERTNFVIYPIAYDQHGMETREKHLGDKCFAPVIRLAEFFHSYKL